MVKAEDYQFATSTIKAAALLSCLVSGVLGDILVVEFQASLTVLTWISAVFVWAGFLVGLFVIRPATDTKTQSQSVLTQLDDVEMDTSRTQRQHIPLEEEQLSSKLSKMHIFLHQLRCLRIAMKSPVVKCMLGLWVIGNAIFQVSYRTVLKIMTLENTIMLIDTRVYFFDRFCTIMKHLFSRSCKVRTAVGTAVPWPRCWLQVV